MGPSSGWQSLHFTFSKATNMAVVTSRARNAYFCVECQLNQPEYSMSGIFGYKFVYYSDINV